MEEPSDFFERTRKRKKFPKLSYPVKNIRNLGKKCFSTFLYPKGKIQNIFAGLVGLFYGIVLTLAFYFIILKDLEFSNLTNYLLTAALGSFLGLGCAISSQLRCITLLAFPAICGKGGRGTLKAFIIAYLLAGPVANLTENGKEIVRSYTCASTMIYKINKLKHELIYQPFYKTLMNLKGDTRDIQEAMKSLDDVIEPLNHEFMEQDDFYKVRKRDIKLSKPQDNDSIDIQVEQNYYKKLENRCETIMSSANENCKKIFANNYEECSDSVTAAAAWALCWPLKLDLICDTVSSSEGNECDPKSEIPTGWGHGYEYVLKARNEMSKDLQNANVSYRIIKPNITLDLRTAEDTAQAIIKEFEVKKSFIDMALLFIKRLMALAFIRVILSASSYHNGYLENIYFSNFYITKYFKKIDARRYKKDKYTLLPLKNTEKHFFVDPLQWKLARKELSRTTSNCLKTFIDLITASTIILIDRLFYETLDLVRRHSKIDFQQSGTHNMTVSVKGTGMMASMVRSVIHGFNFHKNLNETYSNNECLPAPSLLHFSHLKRIYLLYLVLFSMSIFEGYAERLKRLICSLFYPKREKQRILFLFNDTLKKRIAYMRHRISKVGRKVKENRLTQDNNLFLILRMRYPKYLGWLKIFKTGRRKCLICGESEPILNKNQKWRIFECGSCLYIYCVECWDEIERVCIVCFPRFSSDDESVERSEDEID